MNRRLLPLTLATGMALSAVAVAPAGASLLDSPVATHVVALEDAALAGATAADLSAELLAPLGLTAEHVYEHALGGFAVTGPTAAIEALAADARVAYVEADRTFTTQAISTKGVDRIDADEVQPLGTGANVTVDVDVAVIDTGVDRDHPDLNVYRQVNCSSTLIIFSSGCREGSGEDDNGHGTHVSGTIGALDDGVGVTGVAPGARIWGIKVLGGPLGSGSTSDVIAGIDYAAAHADEIEVINMSLGGSGTSTATDDAIADATNGGIVVVVAAGNDSANASGYTPANSPNAITVSAITDLDGKPGALASGTCSGGDDTFATYSNFGSIVDIAAPGSCITSTRNGGGTTSMSGTSMASPHVAGAAAYYVATNGTPANASRWTTTLSGLLATSVDQASACGFTGGKSAEKLLDLNAC